MRFKVGDKVIVRNDLVVNKLYGAAYFASGMVECKGKEFTIEYVYNSDQSYTLKEEGFYWTDDMFEPAISIDISPDDLLSFLEE